MSALDDETIARLADALAVRMRVRVAGKGPPWRTIDDVAAELRCKPSTIRAYIASGELTAHHIGGRWIIAPEDFDAFTRARRIEPGQALEAPRPRRRTPKRGLRARLGEDRATADTV